MKKSLDQILITLFLTIANTWGDFGNDRWNFVLNLTTLMIHEHKNIMTSTGLPISIDQGFLI